LIGESDFMKKRNSRANLSFVFDDVPMSWNDMSGVDTEKEYMVDDFGVDVA